MVNPYELAKKFRDRFGRTPRLFSAPGRVNLIGEHTDYNEGFVLPVAIERNTIVAGLSTDDMCLRAYSLNYEELRELDLKAPKEVKKGDWLLYIQAIGQLLEKRGCKLKGLDLMIESDIPEGAGLSSSAAFEVSLGLALSTLCNAHVEKLDLVLIGQETEHKYIGTNSGIMDQFISMFGKKDHALLIDCRSNTAEEVPMNMTDIALVICDSRIKHNLASSEYNTRRKECEEAVRYIQQEMPNVKSLRDVTIEDFERLKHIIPQPACKRARHVITENMRTLEAAEAFRHDKFDVLGSLMLASHESLRDDYEVSIRELDILVAAAYSVEGIVGARMTGGGFGGCTVNIVHRDAIEDFRDIVALKFKQQTGRELDFYVTEIEDGAKEIEV